MSNLRLQMKIKMSNLRLQMKIKMSNLRLQMKIRYCVIVGYIHDKKLTGPYAGCGLDMLVWGVGFSSRFYIVATGKPERHVCKASHCRSKQQ